MDDLGDDGLLDALEPGEVAGVGVGGVAEGLAAGVGHAGLAGAVVAAALELEVRVALGAVRAPQPRAHAAHEALGLVAGAAAGALGVRLVARAVAAAVAVGAADHLADQVRHGHLDVELAEVGKRLEVEVSIGGAVRGQSGFNSFKDGGRVVERTLRCSAAT